MHKGFGVLAGYLHGANANHTRFPPAVPLVSHFVPRNNFSDGGKEFIVSAFIPRKPNDTSAPPAPSSPDVKIRTFPVTKIYVRQFGGLGFHWSVLHETFNLARALKRNQVDTAGGAFFAAQYDGPTTIFHRHNEVWFVPKSGNSSSTPIITDLWDDDGLTISSIVVD